ncbi:hypothetical protein [Mycolicibacter kumamotonensis]|uniref:hypothetical protein n=1 Tax=Mycolicibacter kumamotonensis TaxID=354243 RepID=UPI00080657E9|nr:hypothetical protein [Mycolicibacter kumamotonensis]
MSAPAPRAQRGLTALWAAPILVAAALLWQHLPDSTDVYAPFDVPGRFGAAASGRSLTVTVDDVRLAPTVQGSARWSMPPPVAAAGRWVVVRASVSATRQTVRSSVQLRVGPNTYQPSDRFPAYTLGDRVDPGITQHGSWVFDVPPGLFEPPGADPFELLVWPGLDERLDDRLVINLRGHLESESATVTVFAPEVSG